MRTLADLKAPTQVNPKHLHRVFFADYFTLTLAALIALVNMVPSAINHLEGALPASWLGMRIACGVTTLCAALSLFLSESTQTRLAKLWGIVFGTLASAIPALSILVNVVASRSNVSRILGQVPGAFRQGSPLFVYSLLLVLGITILFAPSKGPRIARIATGIAFVLSFLVFSLVLGSVFKWAGIPGSTHADLLRIPTLSCIALLTLVVILRRTESGILSLLWGYGTGSRIARFLVPILVLLPMLREIARAHLLEKGWVPASYTASLLTSTGTFLGLALVLILARMINKMQERIQNDILRDELTGLYSLKGFYLLADQAFRHSRRTQESYSVLFVDMDNLKIINDKLGHSIGSVSLVETAKLLSANFRDTEIIGRVGGDEFVVAGQFNGKQIAAAVERLREAVARKNEFVEKQFTISLSMGYAVAENCERESLQSLVAKADEAMYEEKRRKKGIKGVIAPQTGGSSLGSPQNKDAAFGPVGL